MNDKDVTVEEWANEMTKDIKSFVKYWNDQQDACPKTYPKRLGKGDWDDQFTFFTSTQD